MRAFAQYGVFGYELRWTGLNKFELVIEKSGAANVFAGTSNNSAPAGHWYHVTIVYDNKDMKIYLDGELRGTNFFNYDTGNTTPDKNLAIGVRSYDSTFQWYFNGNIDEVAIYNIALSADEIQQHYQNGLSGHSDYHLLPDSPCIDAGDPDYVAEPNETDLDGNPRVIGGRIDMGAYELQNTPPVADAGPDQVVECACSTAQGTKVTLDGTGSYDVDGDLLTYTWSGPFVESPEQGTAPTVTLDGGCPDNYVITLVVNDGIEGSEADDVMITVVDTTPPDINCPADVTLGCPADTSVEANGSATAGDMCGSATIAHSDVWQPGCGNTGTLTRTWTATDGHGNSSSCMQTITVIDTTGPEFQLSVSPTILWPPNHKMELITPLSASWRTKVTTASGTGTQAMIFR
ncbi:MAG: LamG-like jellyroll fold domain-containing protein [Planctomycetota bacterium]